MLPSGWLYIHDYLNRIRVYKFVRLLLLDVQEKNRNKDHMGSQAMEDEEENPTDPGGRRLQTGLYESDSRPKGYRGECTVGAEYRFNGNWDKSHEVLLQHSEKGVLSAACYNMVGSVYRERNQPDQAIPWFRRGIEQDPTYYENYEEIGGILFEKGQLEESLRWFKRGIGQADPNFLHDQSYISISLVFKEAGKIREAAQFFEREKKRLDGNSPKLAELVGDYQLMFSENVNSDTIHDWITSDLEKIVELCRKYDARVVLQNYPFEPEVNHIFGRVAEKRGTLFVNHQKIFKRYIHDGVRDPEVFVPDGHPNMKGYRMMAENLFQVVQDGELQ